MNNYKPLTMETVVDPEDVKNQAYDMYLNDDYILFREGSTDEVKDLFNTDTLEIYTATLVTTHDLITLNGNEGYTLKATSVICGEKVYLHHYNVYDPSGIVLAIYDFKLSEKCLDGGVML